MNSYSRVLIYGQVPPPFHGSNIMTRLFIIALRRLGLEPMLSSKTYSRSIEEVNKIQIIKLIRFIPTFYRYTIRLLSFRPQLAVFFVSSTKIGLLADGLHILITKLFHVPYLLYIHARGHGELVQNSTLWNKIVSFLFAGSCACLVLSKALSHEICLFYKGRIFILPNCADDYPVRFKRTRRKSHRILFLANLNEGKGVFTLLEAVPIVVGKYPRIQFIIAGSWQHPHTEQKAMEFIAQKNLGKHVKLFGPVQSEQKLMLFSNCDLFVFPSHYRFEIFSLVVLEAMQAGLPVIASSIGALPEVVKDGATGYIIPPRNPAILAKKIIALLNSPDLMKKMSQKARERYMTLYSFSAYVDRLGKILKNLPEKR